MPKPAIIEARTPGQAAEVRDLAWEFVGWLRERYPEMEREIDDYLQDQNFEEQINDPIRYFTPPNGECLLARHNDRPVGILMLKPHCEGTCEMNRMFVRPEARGLGIGRALIARLIERARDLGYDTMILSALHRHDEALPLYRSSGFSPYDPGDEDPTGGRSVCMRMDL
jgi:GNAT superfamily N-acetyltransferase